MELSLDTPTRFVPHIGPVMADKLTKLEIYTVQDLLYHVPFRYNDFSKVSPVASVRPGDTVTVTGMLESIKTFVTKSGKRIQEARVTDETGTLSVIWFNQVYLLKVLRPGTPIHLSGKIDWFGTKKVMSNPQYEMTTSLHTGRIVPVYPETEGVTSKWLRGRIAFLLETVSLTDFLPDSIRHTYNLPGLAGALHSVHYPQSEQAIKEGRRRIAFDEVFLLQLRAHQQKQAWITSQRAHALTIPTMAPFTKALPFTLTADQNTALDELKQDLAKTVPMNRLLVGDVGSGKTVVAAAAMYIAHQNNVRSILMAPTQILAHQHYQTISSILTPLGIRVGLVTAQKKETGDILVGTHALLSENVSLSTIGLVVVDEQHRFGVEQRARLVGKRAVTPHFLTMTATPIPRTIAKTLLGNIDTSILTELPGGRKTVKTWVVPSVKRERAYTWIKDQMDQTRGQAFVICPLIEASESLSDVKAVTAEVKVIQKAFPGTAVGLLHGRLKAHEKTKALDDFKAKKTMILVATPVVEVGIDVPNATIMLIEGADRFGLGQLHQLRGRVGRGTLQSYCLLFTESDDESVLARLKALETIYNGPELAELDMKLRGPGEVFGTRQHGVPHLKIASFTDMDTIHQTQNALASLTATDPDLTQFPLLREIAKKGTIQEVSKD